MRFIEKNIKKHNSIRAGAHKVENIVFAQLWPSFSQYSESLKKVDPIYLKRLVLLEFN